MFVRLGHCNLVCEWCDTPYSWDPRRFDLSQELTELAVSDVVDQVCGERCDLVVITGGEPAMQPRPAERLATAIRARGKHVELETNGTRLLGPLEALCRLVVVSPKLANSGMPERLRLRYPVLEHLAGLDSAAFKFVVTNVADLDEVKVIVDRVAIRDDKIWIMPEGTEADCVTNLMRQLADEVAQRGWSLGGRLHIQLWGGLRGH